MQSPPVLSGVRISVHYMGAMMSMGQGFVQILFLFFSSLDGTLLPAAHFHGYFLFFYYFTFTISRPLCHDVPRDMIENSKDPGLTVRDHSPLSVWAPVQLSFHILLLPSTERSRWLPAQGPPSAPRTQTLTEPWWSLTATASSTCPVLLLSSLTSCQLLLFSLA